MKKSGLPAQLTAEEQALLNKFAQIKKKKKECIQLKAEYIPVEAAKTVSVARVVSPSKNPVSRRADSNEGSLLTAKDAKEKVKQLLASGQLKINKADDQRTFKRARLSTDKKGRDPTSLLDDAPSSENALKKSSHTIEPYRKFSSLSDDIRQSDENDHQGGNSENRKRTNNVIFVSGYGLTKDILENSFTKFGSVISTHMDSARGHGFVTFKSSDAAEKAVAEMHGEFVQGFTLKVSFARKRSFDDNRRRWTPREHPDREPNRASLPPRPPPAIPTEKDKVDKDRRERSVVKYSNEDEFDF